MTARYAKIPSVLSQQLRDTRLVFAGVVPGRDATIGVYRSFSNDRAGQRVARRMGASTTPGDMRGHLFTNPQCDRPIRCLRTIPALARSTTEVQRV